MRREKRGGLDLQARRGDSDYMEVIKDSRLIGDKGKPLYGIHEGPIRELNIEGFRLHGHERASAAKNEFLKDFQLKRWQYLGACSQDFIFGIAIVHLGYLSNVFAYLFDRKTKQLIEYGVNQPLAAHTEISGSFLSGMAAFHLPGVEIRMDNGPEYIKLHAHIEGRLNADLRFAHDIPSLSLVTRVGLERFNYTNKEAGASVQGRLEAGGREYSIQEGDARGIIDYTYGYLARYTFWNWAAGAGMSRGGERVGFNLVQGVNETGFTENAFWVGKRLIKTDVIDFDYDDLDPRLPWRMRSNDGKVDLRFEAEGERKQVVNLGLIASQFRQPFGRFSGLLRDGGDSWEIDNASGFVEEHESKW